METNLLSFQPLCQLLDRYQPISSFGDIRISLPIQKRKTQANAGKEEPRCSPASPTLELSCLTTKLPIHPLCHRRDSYFHWKIRLNNPFYIPSNSQVEYNHAKSQGSPRGDQKGKTHMVWSDQERRGPQSLLEKSGEKGGTC